MPPIFFVVPSPVPLFSPTRLPTFGTGASIPPIQPSSTQLLSHSGKAFFVCPASPPRIFFSPPSLLSLPRFPFLLRPSPDLEYWEEAESQQFFVTGQQQSSSFPACVCALCRCRLRNVLLLSTERGPQRTSQDPGRENSCVRTKLSLCQKKLYPAGLIAGIKRAAEAEEEALVPFSVLCIH